jgi:methyl-accepting chemotaxis protein
MFGFLDRLSVRNKIWTMVLLFVSAIVVGSFIDVSTERTLLLSEKRLKTRHLVEAAHSVLAHYYGLQKSGALTEEAAKAQAIQAIKAMRYEQNEYFWLNDFTTPVPKMIMHPTVPALDGKVLDADKFNCATSMQAGIAGPVVETDGKKNLFVAFNEVANRAGSGYVTYDWPKPKSGGGTTDRLFPKLSYVAKFDGWNWLIGSGIYTDDVNQAVQEVAIRNVMLVGLAGALLLAVAGILARSITGPLEQTAGALREIAEGDGDLTKRLPEEGTSEIARLAGAFNQFVAKMQQSLRQVAQASNQLSGSSGRLAGVAEHTTASVRTQEAEAGAVAEAVQGMVQRAHEINQNAETAAAAAQAADGEANAGRAVVEDTIQSINAVADEVQNAAEVIRQLEDDSRNIGAILETIRGIADQTNLLALNAAIEAARAGEQGRGFAVVADEVRKLAQSTQEATARIQDMIGKLQNKAIEAVGVMNAGHERVALSVGKAGLAGESLAKITQAVASIGDLNLQIATHAAMQNVETDQISSSIESIVGMAQETASEVKNSEAAGAELAALVADLNTLVGQFKVD